jgi:hypothetical protein
MPKMKRIQRKRTKGWHMPSNCVYVGRPSKWGNPYPIIENSLRGRLSSIARYKMWLQRQLKDKKLNIEELRGKDLSCWCPLNKECHADILLELLSTKI